MPELSGPVQTLETASWLWLVPFFPILGAAVNALYSSGLYHQAIHALRVWFADDDKPKPVARPRQLASHRTVAGIAIGSFVLSLGAALAHILVLIGQPASERFLFEHVWQLVRVGQLDAGFDLAMDPLAAVMTLLVTAMGALIGIYSASFMTKDASYWRFFAWVGFFVSAMLVLVLADNLLMLFFGWEGTALAMFGLIGISLQEPPSKRVAGTGVGAGIKTFLLHHVGDLFLLFGAAMLFWGFGGRWADGQYQSDLEARVAAVSVTPKDGPHSQDDPSGKGAQATKGRGFVSITALPGSMVYVDDSHTPLLAADGLPIHTPFRRYEMSGGVHSFRIAPDDSFHVTDRPPHSAFVVEGGAQSNYVVQHVAFGGDREVALVVFGSTLTFREMNDQLSVSDRTGALTTRASILARKAGGNVGFLTVACILVLLGACGKSAQLPLHGWLPRAMEAEAPVAALIQAGAAVTAGVYLVARLGFLFSLSGAASTAVTLIGAATGLFAALEGLRQHDLRRVLAYVTLSQVGVMFVAVGAGAYSAGIFHLVSYTLFAGCLFLAAGLVVRSMQAASSDDVGAGDLRKMGGLGAVMPRTAWAYRIGCLALTAAPVPLLAGFWSREDLLEGAFASTTVPWPVAKLAYVAALVSLALASFSLWRSYYLAFDGSPRGVSPGKPKKPASDARAPMVRVLVLVSVLSAISGAFLGISSRIVGGAGVPLLESWLAPTFPAAGRLANLSLVVRYGLAGLSFAVAYVGWAVARRRHGGGGSFTLTPRRVAMLSIGLALFTSSQHAFAQGGHEPRHFPRGATTPPPSAAGPGKIRLSVDGQDHGPLVLTAQNGGYVGRFVVWNDGPGPLSISRVAMRGDDDDPRLPPRFNARFADGGGGSTVIPSHSSKRVSVTWIPDREPKMRQALGHVILTSNDESAGEVAMGFVAQMGTPFGLVTDHLLTLLVLVPLLGALVALAMRIVGYASDDKLRHVTLVLAAVECLLAIVLYQGFHGIVMRADGNDGFQFVERSILVRSLGVEYFVGVDGTSVSMLLLTSVVAFVGAITSYAVELRLRTYHALYGLVISGMIGVFVSLDLFLFYGFWVLTLGALCLLVANGGGNVGAKAARTLLFYAVPGSLLLLCAFIGLANQSDPNFLVDGTKVLHTSAIPELMRVSYNAKHLVLFGFPWIKVIWVALFLGFGVLVPIVPFHGWFLAVQAAAIKPVNVVVAGAGLNLGVYGLLRICVGVLPDGTRWAATTMVSLGVLSVAYGAARALFEEDLKKLLAYASVSQMGFCLIGMGGLTREGIAGAIVQMFSHGLIAAMLFVVAAGLEDRARTRDVARFGGLVADVPLYTSLAGFAFVASMGLPGLSGFWGETLPIIGAFPLHRLSMILVGLGLVVAVGYHLRTFQRIFLGPIAESWRKDPALLPFGGKFPEVSQRDVAALVPLIVLCLSLGFYPSPFFTIIEGGVSDMNQLVNPPGPEELASSAAPDGALALRPPYRVR